MRLAFRIELSSLASCAALCAAAALFVLPAGARAQQANQARSATLADSADSNDSGFASFTNATLRVKAAPDWTTSMASEFRLLAGNVLSLPVDGASVNDFSLDDQVLSRQRGGAVGMLMVAATPQLMRGNGNGNGVTLWDEIAPPSSPLPIPVDAARTAQGNVANYQRK
ncbi:hypothetical protein [Paraburkholderia bryophila]|uniref:Uncharacterized protein n=1 Tax=Paraburkholderia bryophila TaxID=420952 RepID=A0A7Y9W305_9BURK|nr:hypothetical protein [Paraburkholderia bryophila]NYH13346.1 hypothetical protein [Paraburkholderia bryophila]